MTKKKSVYEQAGVNISEGNKAVKLMAEHVRGTANECTISELGSFGGLYEMKGLAEMGGVGVLVSSIDGVGTKVKLATNPDSVFKVGHPTTLQNL